MKLLILASMMITTTISFASDRMEISAVSYLVKHKKLCAQEREVYAKKMKQFSRSSESFTEYGCHQVAVEIIESLTGQSAIGNKNKISVSEVMKEASSKCDIDYSLAKDSSLELSYANLACKDAARKTTNYFLEESLKHSLEIASRTSQKESEYLKVLNSDRSRFQDKRVSKSERENLIKIIRAN